MLGSSAHTDTFSRDNLPPQAQWPDFFLDHFANHERLNAAVELMDAIVANGQGDIQGLDQKNR